MHLLGKDLICYAVTPFNDTINLIKIDNWDFEWQGSYFFDKFLKIPAGSMIYAKGNYDNTVSPTNPSPVLVQSGFNTEDEMFVFIFQFLPYQQGDEDIVIENILTTNILEGSEKEKGKLNYIVDLLGRQTKGSFNTPLFYIYENGDIEKRLIFE